MNQPTERPAGFQGYIHQSQTHEDEELTHVDHGTPSGEYLRRFWQPVAMSSELGHLPLVVKILGLPSPAPLLVSSVLAPNTISLAGEAPPIAVPGIVKTSLSDHPVASLQIIIADGLP